MCIVVVIVVGVVVFEVWCCVCCWCWLVVLCYLCGVGLLCVCIVFECDFVVYEIEVCVEMLFLVGYVGVCI